MTSMSIFQNIANWKFFTKYMHIINMYSLFFINHLHNHLNSIKQAAEKIEFW